MVLIPPIDVPYIILPINPNIVYKSSIVNPIENNIKARPNYIFSIYKSLFLPHISIFFPSKCEKKQIANGVIANIKPIVISETPIS